MDQWKNKNYNNNKQQAFCQKRKEETSILKQPEPTEYTPPQQKTTTKNKKYSYQDKDPMDSSSEMSSILRARPPMTNTLLPKLTVAMFLRGDHILPPLGSRCGSHRHFISSEKNQK
jgi:hypothetical protein